jgi:phenylpyruvate tautomerase PptA (4-oxalocrotonate tautomerase family)
LHILATGALPDEYAAAVPVVNIRALPQPGLDVKAAAARIAAAIAKAGGMPPKDIWIAWTDIPAGRYVILDQAPSTHPKETHPPLVEISSTPRPSAISEAMMLAAAQAVAAELDISENNVRVLYAEIPKRRLYSRGRYQ